MNKIEERLLEMGKSQKWLAKKTGLGTGHVNRIADDRIKNPSILTCFRIAASLDSTIDFLWP